ncbi:MAG: hypothetical protein K2G59_04630 [Muribaculaceae bacterium]|nr:hypothetical protein [Muribaculaceae bacterium]
MKKMIIMVLALAGCVGHGGRPAAVPRPRAYPRVELYPAAYSPHAVGDVVLMVNDSARVVADGLWVDLVYPAYGLTVNCTVTQVTPSTVASVLDNRTERMALNAGGAYGEITRLMTDGGSTATLLATRAGTGLTPIQFMATDSAAYVLSGAVTFSLPVDPDSIRPVVDAVGADLLYLLQKL